MASCPALAAPQYTPLPAAAAASSINQTCDHHLVDLLWFYGCAVATLPSAFCADVDAHNNIAASGAVDHKFIGACAQDSNAFHLVPQHPAPAHQLQSVYTASPHQSPRKPRGSWNSTCVGINKPSHPSHKHRELLNAADGGIDVGLGRGTKGDAATVAFGAKVDNAPVPCLQQCQPSAPPASAKWLRQVFNTFDENKDGMLSAEELRRSLEKLGIEASNESIGSLLSQSPSKDQKGLVSQDDFLLLYQGAASCTQCALHHENNAEHIDCKTINEDGADEELLWDAFNVFDKDGDGFISPIELQSVLRSLGFGAAQELDECTEMIKKYDQDGDGQVDFEEFKAMLNAAIKHT